MAKAKISKTVKERFKITSGGKLLHKKAGVKHRMYKERASLRTRGRRLKSLTGRQRNKIRKLLGI
ncbi:hypothetical protein A2797_01825 [candidate division WWE3 bacterium RIFCSPHIGHO2_01_FULL_48_15]|uniref:50S ribosomal protein L35 n=1 Tax=candidate division WWE3 bacterium RIFCSPHIGHO2_01_FULL_48_15 TaxID=1802619 RepID=A0A1F4VFN8_UNCKA|nr:MAG: hypothetical protein A2797_01825 [candidate division WWE3 bacterium RIFCSPHIGHO2_01_FULL_48_15]